MAALKQAKPGREAAEALAREARLLARVERRWGPALLDAGPGYVASEWVVGTAVEPSKLELGAGERRELAAVVAHAVGRALEELHQARVRHGDVKPANVLLGSARPSRDLAADRGATLIDLGLATGLGAPVLGGTPRYAAPELRDHGEAGAAADLWALGVLLAEVLEPRIAAATDPAARAAAVFVGSGGRGSDAEPRRWVQALLAASPGGRPSAAWVAQRAVRWLGLRDDQESAARARADRVRRTYLAERARDLTAGAVVADAVDGPARAWLDAVLGWERRLGGMPAGKTDRVEPLGAVRRARWLVSLVGTSAASWPLGVDDRTEGAVVERALELARDRDPASWTLEDFRGLARTSAPAWDPTQGDDRIARLTRELARPAPALAAVAIAEDDAATGRAPTALAVELAAALVRAGETGRAWAALAGLSGGEVEASRAEIARRRGDPLEAQQAARLAIASGDDASRWRGQATLGRIACDGGELDAADVDLEGARGAAAAEVRALVAWRRGAFDVGLRAIEHALAEPIDADANARLESVRGLLEWSRGGSAAALHAFGRAVDFAARAGAVVDEATYLTSEAAAAADAGQIGKALSSGTRAALLWERIGHPVRAARAWLDRAGALAAVGEARAADEAAEEARARAIESGDSQAVAYARWAQAEVRTSGDVAAHAYVVEADARLRAGTTDDQARSAARLLLWAPDRIDDSRIGSTDAAVAALPPATRWEWWGARAAAILAGRTTAGDGGVLGALVGLIEVAAPVGSKGPALDAAARLALERGDGDAARRFEQVRAETARALREGTPEELRPSLRAIAWVRAPSLGGSDVSFAPAQVAQLEAIVRALSVRDRLRPLLEQVLDTLILWTGVERGLLLLRAPNGRLIPRAARNLARRDLTGEQLALSHTIAARALALGDVVVATDALSTLGDAHASIHHLKLRSVLALPLVARGEGLGVVYLDDRGRKGAFGPRELAWVRVVASQAALAIADARDAVLLRRAVRRAERARGRLESALQKREEELDVTRTQLELARDGAETRFRYDEIAGRSEPMRELLHLVDKVTASDVPVLVIGESGTGKELVARAMHANGRRGRRAFVSENCASVPETLLESTLFGHLKGAFTGASAARAGLFDVADGGTLFLDEIGEMSMAMQAKLLRVLQDGKVRPVGGERERAVDVRVVAATHRDLAAMVASGTFREDLFYRLNVISLRVPPLRERADDIPPLVDHFVRKHAPGRAVKITRAAMAKIVAFSWPGNVRQLENEVRRALVLGEGAIDVAELSAEVARGGGGSARGAGLDLRARVDLLETELVIEALAKTRGNQTRAAQLLGVSRFGLQKMMKRLKIAARA
jgi:transcriptional regulator with GAF, ATPase, and Fis domain/tetratricopeptide (TPR) repeat protein